MMGLWQLSHLMRSQRGQSRRLVGTCLMILNECKTFSTRRTDQMLAHLLSTLEPGRGVFAPVWPLHKKKSRPAPGKNACNCWNYQCCCFLHLFKNWDQCETHACNILWHEISFRPVQVTALNWGFLASNILSVMCQGIVLLGWKCLNPHLQAWAEWCLRCSRAWCGLSLKTVEALLLQ